MSQHRLGEIKLGQTSRHKFLAFQPPITPEQCRLIASVPTANEPDGVKLFGPEIRPEDGSAEVAIKADSFVISGNPVVNELTFVIYAQQVAHTLGTHALHDETIHNIGPGPSIFQQANGAQPI